MSTPADSPFLNRRSWLASAAAIGAAACATAASAQERTEPTKSEPQVIYCLNTSTIMGQKLSVPQQIEVAARAGYGGIEPWIRDLQKFVENGGNLADLRKQIADHGLIVASAIGFPEWIVDDDARRAAGLEQAKREMDLVRLIGGRFIAAPPAGATKDVSIDLRKAADRYRALLELGEKMEVTPQLELWGFSTTLGRLSEVLHVAAESGHPSACVLPDVYHLYKGGSDPNGLKLVSGTVIHCIHMNDYPADPPRETIRDRDRIYPGDGIAPLTDILRTLLSNGFRGALSLEVFNESYWQQDALAVCLTGLAKMKEAVGNAAAT